MQMTVSDFEYLEVPDFVFGKNIHDNTLCSYLNTFPAHMCWFKLICNVPKKNIRTQPE